jgi:outer membrane protein OmpA-like peptidoglycan-associated protein
MVESTKIDSRPNQFVFCSEKGAWACKKGRSKTLLSDREKHRMKTDFELEKSVGKDDEFFEQLGEVAAEEIRNNQDSIRLFFEFDSVELSERSIKEIERIVYFSETKKLAGIVLSGFTDSIGTKSYNEDLALNRAKAVKSKMESFGITNKLLIKGQGKCCFLADNESEIGRSKNRRVEIHFMDRKTD